MVSNPWQARKDSFKNFMLLNPLQDADAHSDFVAQRCTRVQTLLALLILKKLGHIYHIVMPLHVPFEKLVQQYPGLAKNYPVETEEMLELSGERYINDCRLSLLQMILSTALILCTIWVLRQYQWFFKFMPWMCIVILAFEMPNRPIYPSGFFCLMIGEFFATIYQVSLFTCSTMIQGVAIYTALFVVFLLQLNQYQMVEIGYTGMVTGFFFVGMANFALIMSEVAYSVKEMFAT